MYLKSLTMQGFKSFADKTEIKFHNGVTCIVGPNGSGKSNISDAIRWVLGEQSIKSLRGNKMEDFIFSGTDKRKALGMAEVSLVFDNSDNYIPIDYSEVVIKRRLFRSGESEYYINNNPCRLKDIRELFMDTGIGKDGYSIIGQGQIAQILSNNPDERRAVFHEAAGISKFKYKRAEAVRKLDATQNNLIRLNDIIIELKDRLEYEKKEAENTKLYNELFESLKTQEVYNNLMTIKRNENDLKKFLEELEQNSAQLTILNEELKANSQSSKEILLNTEKLDEKIESQSEAQKQLTEKASNIKSVIDISKNTIESKTERISRIDGDLKEIELEISELKENIDADVKTMSETQAEFLNVREKFEEYNLQKQQLEKELQNNKLEIDTKSEEIDNLKMKISKIDLKLNTSSSIRNDRLERIEYLNSNLNLLLKNREEFENSINNCESEIESIKLNKKSLLNKTEKYKADIFKFEKDIEKENKIYNNKKAKLESAKSQLKLLESMENNYEGYFKSIKDFINASRREKIFIDKIEGTLADLISTDEKYEKALSVALGSSLQNIVVKDAQSAKKMIEYLNKKKYGRITFLPMDTIKPRMLNKRILEKYKSIAVTPDRLVKYDNKYENIIKNLLGNSLIVENMDHALDIAKKEKFSFRIITLNGDTVNAGGSMTSSYIDKGGSILFRKNKIVKLKNTIIEDENDLLCIKTKIDKFLKDFENTKDKYDKELSSLGEYDTNIGKLELRIESLKSSEKSNELHLAEYLTQVESLKAQIVDEDDLNKKINTDRDDLTNDLNILENELKNIEKDYQKLINDYNLLDNSNTDQKIKYNQIQSEIKIYQNSIERNRKILDGDELRKDELNDEKNKLIQDIENLKNEISTNNLEYLKLLETIKLNDESNELKIRKRELIKSYNDIQIRNDEIRDLVLELEKRINYLELQDEKLSNKKLEIKEYLDEFYNIKIDLDNIDEQIEKPNVRISVAKVKSQMEKLGQINPQAIEAYNLTKERYEFNNSQYNDLIQAKKDLEKLISNLEKNMKDVFYDSVEEINNNFKEIFKLLFGGGQAEILLIEPEDEDEPLLNSNIEIKACPPGKNMQTISLLSGGEKALTSVAIIFSLLKTRPAPFCLLDEIDAALDDANIRRYMNYLETLKDIQFAIITHRKTTMEIGDTLYGITMQNPGISDIISMKLE
ncbi:MAG: chromosome segregation protein SMC [Tissierellia bacterium]|nr:chromosome segregation protein SMC [Tissierellia bacterium]